MHHQVQDPLIGQVIAGRYAILQRIGEGGMGVVYQARQTSIDRIVAIKMLNPQMAQDPNWVQRFNNEARACSQLQHPNTIRMFEFGQTSDGRPFMAMEFLDGQSLRDAILQGAMQPARVVKILIQCCASLAEAHAIGIIHRDIKPDNVFLLSMAGSPDFVKLLDFSVAKLLADDRMKTQAGVVFGTPQYMSPEQGRGIPLDPRADLYSLGILAYEMLTGRVPFNDDNPMTVLQMHIRQPLPPLPQNIPPMVQSLVYRALEKEPGKRFQSAGEMMQHCQQVFQQVGGQGSGFALPQGAPIGGRPIQMGSPQMGGSAQFGGGATAIASPQMGGAAGYGGQAPQSMQAADPGAKTVLAGQAPPGLQDMIRQQSSAEAKTIIAGVNAPAQPVQPVQPVQPAGQGYPYGGAPQMPGPPSMPGGGAGDDQGPPKTIMLPNTEGVVSISGGHQQQQRSPGSGASPAQAGYGHPGPGYQLAEDSGPGALYWAVCLFLGLAAGVLAYVLVLKLG